MAYHLVHNSLGVLMGRITAETLQTWPILDAMLEIGKEGGVEYSWNATVIAGLCGMLVLLWIKRLPYHPCAEERLQTARDQQSSLLHAAPA